MEVPAEEKAVGSVLTLLTRLENQGCVCSMHLDLWSKGSGNHPAPWSFRLHLTSISYMVHYWYFTEGSWGFF